MRAGLLSWGRHPPHPQTPHAVHWRDEAPTRLAALRETHGSTLAYGLGRSYGDSCLAASDQVLHVRGLDRFIAADWQRGALTAEAGVTLGELLALCVPRGWFLPVTPGTRQVTLGGAVANDVHGKNHHVAGTFGRHVRRLGLLRSDRGRLECAPDQEPELFAATIGGLGLSGVIEWVELQLCAIGASRIDCVSQRFGELSEFFALSDELDPAHAFCVSWIDCAAGGARLGRGIYSAGNFAEHGSLRVEPPGRLGVPLTPPFSLVNRLSVRAFDTAYWHRHPARRLRRQVGYGPFFYPLDGLRDWNRLYGRRGFQQYQCVVPPDDAQTVLTELLGAVAEAGAGSFLAVLKRCGDLPSPGLLSFPRPGVTLALDFAQSTVLDTLFARLDAIVREAGGRLYPAKDAHLRGDDFRRQYPAWEQVEALRDPALLSRLWQRVTA